MNEQDKPIWVKIKEELKNQTFVDLEFTSLTGVDEIKDGLLPNGEIYDWKKRRP